MSQEDIDALSNASAIIERFGDGKSATLFRDPAARMFYAPPPPTIFPSRTF
jgi:hypothetical protein